MNNYDMSKVISNSEKRLNFDYNRYLNREIKFLLYDQRIIKGILLNVSKNTSITFKIKEIDKDGDNNITSNLINKIIVEDINLRTLYSWKLVRSFLNQDIYNHVGNFFI